LQAPTNRPQLYSPPRLWRHAGRPRAAAGTGETLPALHTACASGTPCSAPVSLSRLCEARPVQARSLCVVPGLCLPSRLAWTRPGSRRPRTQPGRPTNRPAPYAGRLPW